MSRYFICILLFLIHFLYAEAGIIVGGSSVKSLSVNAEASSGLDEVVVVYDAGGVTLTYESFSRDSRPIWMKYGNLGGGYAETIDDVTYDGNKSTVRMSRDDAGYLIEDGDRRYYFWAVNYSNHYFTAKSLSQGTESDCSRTSLMYDGDAHAINYYGINGRQFVLSRELKLVYNTLVYDEDRGLYNQVSKEEILSSINGNIIHLQSPLCDTDVTLSGDRFLREWGYEETVVSPTISAIAVEAYTTAIQSSRNVENEKHTEGVDGVLGGSAPCEIEFTAAVSDAAIFTEWQFSRSREFDDIDIRVNDLQTIYTFREDGETYVRFVCADASGECEYYSDTYTVSIGSSSLDCPNAFSPGVSEGVNDEWRVSYRSIVSFECHIFNRWGTKMISFTDPSQGWDGKYGGKFVPAGVYFYVIKAKGADGKEYKLSGDINVVNYE